MNPTDSSPEQASSPEHAELVTVARFRDPSEVQLARGALEAAGIDVVLQGENANSLYPGAFGARLLVGKDDEADARELLAAAAVDDSGDAEIASE